MSQNEPKPGAAGERCPHCGAEQSASQLVEAKDAEIARLLNTVKYPIEKKAEPSPCGISGHTMATWVMQLNMADEPFIVDSPIVKSHCLRCAEVREATAKAYERCAKLCDRRSLGYGKDTPRGIEAQGCAEGIRSLQAEKFREWSGEERRASNPNGK